MMSKILEDFNWLKKYSGYPDKCATLESVIRKATPKKVVVNHQLKQWGYRCPSCNGSVEHNYCGRCGQMLDWNKNEINSI